MNYRNFFNVQVGIKVTDGERIGLIIKKSKDNSKALVRFSDGYTEWVNYFQIEIL